VIGFLGNYLKIQIRIHVEGLLNMSTNKKASNTAVLILSHLMDENGILNDETKVQINRGLELFKDGKLDFIITSGCGKRCTQRVSSGWRTSPRVKKIV
jgi:hypothetical protein